MFWGMLLEPGTRYKTTVSEAFAITHAALEYKNPDDNACVKILYKELEFIICYLNAKTERQVSLDLKFDVGEECVVTSIGSGIVHLTGYSEQEEDQDDEDQLLALALREAAKKKKDKLEDVSNKTGKQEKGKARKEKVAFEESSDDDDEDDSDFEGLDEEEDDEEDVDEEGENDDDEDEEESDVEMEEEKPQRKLTKAEKKQLKKDQMKPAAAEKQFKKPIEMELKPQGKKGKLQEQNGDRAEVGTPEMAKKKKKKNKYLEDSDVSGEIILPLKKAKMAGDSPATHLLQTPRGDVTQKKWGITMTTISKGNGPVATAGKKVIVHCRGFVKTTGKEFEKYGEGKPLSFVLGKNEVIRGLDIGVKGMTVGEKRRLEIPPKAGYGDDGRPPKVPPHATLLYDVELKSVS